MAYKIPLFIDMWKVGYAVSMTNCTAALHVCCMVCGLGPGDEVLVPSLTFAASVNSIRYAGATPVFCDIIGPDHINIDPKEIEKKITPKTKAIVVVHMAGFPAHMDEIMAIARRHNLKVIEDACHGPLSEYKGKRRRYVHHQQRGDGQESPPVAFAWHDDHELPTCQRPRHYL